jgi:hypothetical protein
MFLRAAAMLLGKPGDAHTGPTNISLFLPEKVAMSGENVTPPFAQSMSS